ncbi:T9SS type A sorting domain-containing protein [Flavobacteriales bacterium]|nr:T9SS type A sorting domain-containing protein [Flavobacteriales bacterium]
MKKLQTLFLAMLLLTTIADINAQIPPCNLTGGSVYIDVMQNPSMMNATVNGMSMYNYSWTDTNGLVISTANQTPFYTQWCVTIVDSLTGCDTTICQDCTAGTAVCMCTMIYLPVCGCDGVMYSNSCLADCADVPWTPAISNGMPGGFLPCTQPSTCEVEIDGDSIICNWGDSILLEASPTASSTPFVSYVWSTGATGHILSTIANFPGVYSVIATDSTGCISTASFSVAVEEIVIYSAPSPPIICLGDSIVLEIDTAGLSNIVWVPSGSVNTINRVVDYPIIPTIYVVEALDANGCERRGEILVTIDSCITLPCAVEINNGTIDIEICDGDTTILEATSGFDTYVWTLASVGTPLGTTHFISVTDPGLYIVIATDSTNCVDMDSIEVVVYQSPSLSIQSSPNPPIICLGDSVILEGSSGFVDYWWVDGNGSALGIDDKLVDDPLVDTWYMLVAKDSNDCIVKEDIWVYVDSCPTNISNILEKEIRIYPNPSEGIMIINLPKNETFELVIFDISGKLVLSEEKVMNNFIIDANLLLNGIYIMKLTHNSGLIIKKIIFE